MSKDYENLMDSLTNTRYLDTPLEYFKILDDDVEEGSLRQQLAGGGVVTRQNFSTKGKVSSPTQSKLDKLEEKNNTLTRLRKILLWFRMEINNLILGILILFLSIIIYHQNTLLLKN